MTDAGMSSLRGLAAALPAPVFVLGSTGFIGANLLRLLLASGNDAYGSFFSGSQWRLRGLPSSRLVHCNLTDAQDIADTLKSVKPRVVLDCSAFGAYSFEKDFARIHQTNYLALIRMLELLESSPLKAYVHAGSSSEYGLNASAPEEDSPLLPNSHYAISKGAASLAIKYYGKIRGLPAVNLRVYSAYGPYEDPNRLIPVLCREINNGRLPNFARAQTSRDFIHINDVMRAFLLAATRMDANLAGNSINVGTGVRTSLRDLADLCRKKYGIAQEPVFSMTQAHAWDVDDWVANIGMAEKLLDFRAAISLENGLERARLWWKNAEVKKMPVFSKKDAPAQLKNSITAVIACYRDNQAIPIMYERLKAVFQKLNIEYEIIFVNDASPDDSEAVIQALSANDHHVKGISHSRNFGSQAAFRSGMELATKEAVVLLDGDLQDPPEIIEKFVSEWRNGADVVYGRRKRREMPFLLESCYKGFYSIMAKTAEFPIPKDAGDFSLIDRRVARELLKCDERDYFLRGLRAYVGFNQVGVDYFRPERMFGKSTNNWIKNIGWAKKGIFSFTRIPLHLMSAFGFLATLGTLILGFWCLISRIFFPDNAPRGITITLLLILFFGSSTLLCLGLLGEYIGKIFEESKKRPPFIRKKIILDGASRDDN